MCGEDLAALHQMRKSERGGDADTPGVELNLRVCSCAGLLRASLPRSFINDNEGDGQIIRSQSLSLSLSFYLSLPLTLSLSLRLSRFVTISFSLPLFSLHFHIHRFRPHLCCLSFSTFCLSSTSSQT